MDIVDITRFLQPLICHETMISVGDKGTSTFHLLWFVISFSLYLEGDDKFHLVIKELRASFFSTKFTGLPTDKDSFEIHGFE